MVCPPPSTAPDHGSEPGGPPGSSPASGDPPATGPETPPDGGPADVPGTETVDCVTAANPSGMTLDGTNTYLVGAQQARTVVVVDPGPAEGAEDHLAAVLAAAGERRVELILITHHHEDHTGAAELFHERTGAGVRAWSRQQCRDADPLGDGEIIEAAGTLIRVMHTPGHTSDSVSFVLDDDGPAGSAMTGDTVLGRGTTMLDHPDGTMADYLHSLETLEQLGEAVLLPAHGPQHPVIGDVVQRYRAHRQERLKQIQGLLERWPERERAGVTAAELAEEVYPGLTGRVQRVAEMTMAAQLAFLRSEPRAGN